MLCLKKKIFQFRNTDIHNRQTERKYVKRNTDVKVEDLVHFRYYELPHQEILAKMKRRKY